MNEDGNEVVGHALISDHDWRGDGTLDPRRSLLSERHPETLAERVAVPRRNPVPKPPELSFEEAACLPTAWQTATGCPSPAARWRPGRRSLSRAPVATWRRRPSPLRRPLACASGAPRAVRRPHAYGALSSGRTAFEPGARLREGMDVVLETVVTATWSHSLKSLKARRHRGDLRRDEW